MSSSLSADPAAFDASPPRVTSRRIAVVRAVVALAWAVALVVAVGDAVPSTGSDVPVAAALLLAAYPLIDVVASLAGVALRGTAGRVLRINAVLGAAATVAIAATAFGSDAGATLAAFGVWAAVSGALQFGVAVRGRSTETRRVPLLISGGLSTVAGLSFLASSGADDAHLGNLAGYMALGAVLFLASAYRGGTTPPAAR